MTLIQQLLQKPCMPPSRFQRFAYCHWVVKIDYDGRELSKEIWQWQPHAKSWCKPGNVPTGEANQLLGYIHVALCPYPSHQRKLKSSSQRWTTLVNDCSKMVVNMSMFREKNTS